MSLPGWRRRAVESQRRAAMRPLQAQPSPNIWHSPEIYEVENRAVDPEGRIEAAMEDVVGTTDWSGRTVLDVGCGSGFHLPRWAARGARVIGVEPHPPLVDRARRRIAGLSDVRVEAGVAAALPVPDRSVDIVHARWAYFFGPGCEPGLAELDRVMRRRGLRRPGGTAFVVDNDATRSTFGGWFRRAYPRYDAAAVERFWTAQGWRRTAIDMRWSMRSRADFEAVVRIEFPDDVAESILAEHPGQEVDYAVNLWWKAY